MGSGDPSGLQNQRAASSMSLVGSTPTRFRQIPLIPLSRFGSFRRKLIRADYATHLNTDLIPSLWKSAAEPLLRSDLVEHSFTILQFTIRTKLLGEEKFMFNAAKGTLFALFLFFAIS